MDKTWAGLEQTVYVLRAPHDRLVRYVGRTAFALDVRLAQHRYDALNRLPSAVPNTQRPMARWIRRLARAGMTPTIEVVSVMPARYAPAMERRLIQKVYAGPWLLNVTYNYWWTRRQTMVPRIGRWIPIRPKTRRQPTGRIWRPRP